MMYIHDVDHVGATLRVNAGGNLAPEEVVGRGGLLELLWRHLRSQSVLLTAERRMGKTSLLHLMASAPPPAFLCLNRSLQAVATAEEFAGVLVREVERGAPGIFEKTLATRLREAGITKVGVAQVSVEFSQEDSGNWKTAVETILETVSSHVDELVVFLWDEVPHMLEHIQARQGPLVAREILDVLRSARESHDNLRMVFSGSIGIHHVVAELRATGGMWAPTHDMLVVDLLPLGAEVGVALARTLLVNESIDCSDVEAVAATIAAQTDCVPYYIHHVVLQLLQRQGAGLAPKVDEPEVRSLVTQLLESPLDELQLGHYVDRVEVYYGASAALARALLDACSLASGPVSAEELFELVSAVLQPPARDEVQGLLGLLCKDHYLVVAAGRFRFKLELVRRAWVARRNLGAADG